MGEIHRRRTLEPVGPAGAFMLTDAEVAEVGEGAKAFPVTVTVNGHVLQLRLARMGGVNCIGLRREIRTEAGVELGSDYDVVIAKDESVRTVDVPDDLAAALASAGLTERFAALAHTHRKEYVVWVTEAKREQTRIDRIAKAVTMVEMGQKRS
ncbi:MAG TPA: YdeI/OmpD-associated family protein [Propionibacteriaceae bacterium]|nr:YdeI/OmpD-associated family protein [Propionibacteriaceae bacterium]HPZ50661.1 YdeI/OmpD-associated family protein [Propionibacteriaceae bacterium]